MGGAGHLVALDGALRQVAAHVPAVAVEHVELPLAVLPDHELAAEGGHRVRLPVGELLLEAEAVPATRVAVRGDAPVELPGGCAGRRHADLLDRPRAGPVDQNENRL